MIRATICDILWQFPSLYSVDIKRHKIVKQFVIKCHDNLRQFTTIYDIFCPVPFLPSPFGFRRFVYALSFSLKRNGRRPDQSQFLRPPQNCFGGRAPQYAFPFQKVARYLLPFGLQIQKKIQAQNLRLKLSAFLSNLTFLSPQNIFPFQKVARYLLPFGLQIPKQKSSPKSAPKIVGIPLESYILEPKNIITPIFCFRGRSTNKVSEWIYAGSGLSFSEKN